VPKQEVICPMPRPEHEIPIFVINLKQSVHRREAVQRDADRLGLHLSFVDAVDGRKTNDLSSFGYSLRANRDEYGRLLTAGEVGCYASHLKVARMFLSLPNSYAIVLEDDAKLDIGFADFYNNAPSILQNVGRDIALINLCNIAVSNKRSDSVFEIKSGSISLHETFEFPTVARGILWSKSGANHFIDKGKVIAKPVDHFFKDWLTRNEGGYCLRRPVVESHGFSSDIGSGTSRRELSFGEALRYDYARAKRDFINDYFIFKRRFLAKMKEH